MKETDEGGGVVVTCPTCGWAKWFSGRGPRQAKEAREHAKKHQPKGG